MAFSITVDAEFWDDPRKEDLELILGEQRALGACLLAWYLSRKYWLQDKRLIPEAVWKARKVPEALIDTGLAIRKPEGIFVVGVEKFSEKYEKAVAKAKAGAEARWGKKPNENKEPEMPEAVPEAVPEAMPEAMRKQCHLDLDLDSNLKKKEEERAGNFGPIKEFSENSLVAHFLKNVRCALQVTWVEVYKNPEWIKQEIFKAIMWERSNPHKTKKDKGRFMTNWLSRGYERIQERNGTSPMLIESTATLDTEFE